MTVSSISGRSAPSSDRAVVSRAGGPVLDERQHGQRGERLRPARDNEAGVDGRRDRMRPVGHTPRSGEQRLAMRRSARTAPASRSTSRAGRARRRSRSSAWPTARRRRPARSPAGRCGGARRPPSPGRVGRVLLLGVAEAGDRRREDHHESVPREPSRWRRGAHRSAAPHRGPPRRAPRCAASSSFGSRTASAGCGTGARTRPCSPPRRRRPCAACFAAANIGASRPASMWRMSMVIRVSPATAVTTPGQHWAWPTVVTPSCSTPMSATEREPGRRGSCRGASPSASCRRARPGRLKTRRCARCPSCR